MIAKRMAFVLILACLVLLSSVSPAYAMSEKSSAMATAHGFDLAAICRRVYPMNTTPSYDLSTSQYSVYAADQNNAYSLRCARIGSATVWDKNYADGIGNPLGWAYGWSYWDFNLYNACKKMNPNGQLQLGSAQNPWSWSCLY